MKKCIPLIITFIMVMDHILLANMILDPHESTIKIFFTKSDIVGVKSRLIGKVLSFATDETMKEKMLYDTYKEKSRVVVRLYDKKGIKKNDTLYIIDHKNLVIARFKVDSMFLSHSFGFLLIGYGNFSQADIGFNVVQKIVDEHSSYAFVHVTRGDYYMETGDMGKAIYEYKNAIKLDRGNPAAHLALGSIYYERGMIQFAMKEYQESYRNMYRLYDNEDKFLLLKGLTAIRYKQVYESAIPQKLKKSYIEEGINYGKEALSLYESSVDVTYMLGMFNYKSHIANEVKARDYFKKVIEMDPRHVSAHIALTELYLKHNNKDKALHYLQKSRSISPHNKRVRELMLYLRQYN